MISLRPATIDDVLTLERWDRDPAVIAATTDDPGAEQAFGNHDWREELLGQSADAYYLMAELDGVAIGALQLIDPRREPTHYWGPVTEELRAIDIWIGHVAQRGRGHGAAMMQLAHALCFAEPAVTAIVIDPLASNQRAIAFYQRLGYEPVARQMFGDDDCHVHRLDRAVWERRDAKT